jgi:hypothetical protein
MSTIIKFCVAILLLLLLFLYFVRKPVINKRISHDNLKKYLEVLFYRGFDGGFMVIRIPKDKKFKRFLQFSKYIGSKKKIGLQFDYPLAEWSKPYYGKLKEIFEQEGIEFQIEKTDQKGVSEFIVVDVGKDLDKAEKISRLALTGVYNQSPDDFVELYFVNVSEEDERIGF